jgi:hypothetical protein
VKCRFDLGSRSSQSSRQRKSGVSSVSVSDRLGDTSDGPAREMDQNVAEPRVPADGLATDQHDR